MQDRPLWVTARNLVLALLNATLILAGLVLWLGWRTADAVHEVTDDIGLALADLDPLRASLVGVGDEVAGLRADLAELQTAPADENSALSEDLVLSIERLEALLTSATGRLDTLLAEPEALIDRAIETTADEMKEAVADMRGCEFPDV